MVPRLRVSVVGLGAPAASYYPGSLRLLDGTLVTPDYAHVANTLGAVVDSIRQEQTLIIHSAVGVSGYAYCFLIGRLNMTRWTRGFRLPSPKHRRWQATSEAGWCTGSAPDGQRCKTG